MQVLNSRCSLASNFNMAYSMASINMIDTDPKKIDHSPLVKGDRVDELLNRAVEEILPNKENFKKLLQRKRIKVYLGVDPTAPRLHLGHTIGLKKLQQFADMGHEAILVIGTGTVLAGDPSLRDEARPQISREEIKENIKTWREQAGRVLDFSKVKIKYNGDWLLKLGLADILRIASHISAIKLFQREMFQRRIKRGNTVWMNETLYPLLQGYDSVAMDIDLEIGGTDQVFNMLIGRELRQKMQNKEKFVLTFPMILGTDGRQMSKSSGNCIWLLDSADQMFGKVMSIPDGLILSYFELLTEISSKQIFQMRKDLKNKKLNPRDAKARLAFEVVKFYHSEEKAEKAGEEFNRTFKEKKTPSKMPVFVAPRESYPMLQFLVDLKLAKSKGEARRLVEQGGIKTIQETRNKKQETRIIKDWQGKIKMENGMVVQAGKRKFVKIIREDKER